MKKFILNMKGGKKSLLVNSTNPCEKQADGRSLNIKGQNGKKVKNNKYQLQHQLAAAKKKK